MSVPNIALRSQIGHSQFAAKDFRRTPFDEFVYHRGRHGQIEGQQIAPKSPYVHDPHENFAQRIGQKQPIQKMHQTIEMIPLPTEHIVERSAEQALSPSIVGNFGVGVVRAHQMQAHEKEDERVGGAREWKAAIASDERGRKYADQDVLQNPIGAVIRSDREDNPLHGEQAGQNQDKAAMRGVHGACPTPRIWFGRPFRGAHWRHQSPAEFSWGEKPRPFMVPGMDMKTTR